MARVEVPFRFEAQPLLWTVEQVYSPAECLDLIERIEQANPDLATRNPMYRNQDRLIIDDARAAAIIFERLRPHLPATMGSLQLVGINARLRLYRYQVGQFFAPHMDHWYRPNDAQITLLSVLIYLNSGFVGGQTRFMEQVLEVVQPQVGLAAVFQHKIRHEGLPVEEGVKYVMRTDVIYGLPGPA